MAFAHRVASVFLCAMALGCASAKPRPPLEEVPIGATPDNHDPVAINAAPGPTASAPDTSTNGSVADRAKALSSHGDNAGARALLEPRVNAHTATVDEISLLRGICKAAHDKACIAKLK